MSQGFDRPESLDWLEPIAEWKARWLVRYAEQFQVVVFRESYRQTLRSRYGAVGLQMVEAAISSASIDDAAVFNERRAGVARLARRMNLKIHRVGKQPKAELRASVECLAPVLLYLGLPLASGSYSPLVIALRELCQQLGVEGDPRSELRRLRGSSKKRKAFIYQVVIQAAIDGVRPENGTGCSPDMFTNDE